MKAYDRENNTGIKSFFLFFGIYKVEEVSSCLYVGEKVLNDNILKDKYVMMNGTPFPKRH